MAANEQVRSIQEGVRGLTFLTSSEGRQKFVEEVMYGGSSAEVLIFGTLGKNSPLGHHDMLDESNQTNMEVSPEGVVLNRDRYPMLQRKIAGPEADGEVFSKEIHLASNPLTLRCHGQLIEGNAGERKYKVTIKSDFINMKGKVLEKDRVHSEGEVVFLDHLAPPPEPMVDLAAAVQSSATVDLDKFYDVGGPIITFGPTFRYLRKAWMMNDKEMIGLNSIPDDDRIFSYTSKPRFLIAPILLDNTGRLCLLLDFHNNGYVVVPRYIGEAFRYGKMPAVGDTIYSYVKLKKREGDLLYFDMQLLDEKKVYMHIKDIVMIRIGNVGGDHRIV